MGSVIAFNVAEGWSMSPSCADRHIFSYLQGFLFTPSALARRFATFPSADRVLLAKLFTKPHNLLVLDEPMNDLDLEMLEVLEAQLADLEGTSPW